MMDWFPIDICPPPLDVFVLVSCITSHGDSYVTLCSFLVYGEWFLDGDLVVAWAPLPDPFGF